MNKIVFKFLLILWCLNIYPLVAEVERSIEIRSAAFFHSSKRFREIYGMLVEAINWRLQ